MREWLNSSGGWGDTSTYDPATGRYSLTEEQAFALLELDLPGAFLVATAGPQGQCQGGGGVPDR